MASSGARAADFAWFLPVCLPASLMPKALDGQRRLMDKLDFLSFLESTRREFQARILNFPIDDHCAASALAQNAQGSRVSAQMRLVLCIIHPDRRFVLPTVIPTEGHVRMITPPGGLDIARQGVKRSAFGVGVGLTNRACSDELLDDRRDPPDREH